jgi:hypothetical protein
MAVMQQPITSEHHTDDEGRPAGGLTTGTGIVIEWQNGPLALEPINATTCGCGEPATWAYDPEAGAAGKLGGSHVPYCDAHGPNTPPRREPNGAFVEGVIAAALDRLEHYQSSPFRCRENALAITKLEEALHWCQHRTAARLARGVEGTHTA